jgi:hypothetical protein
MQMKAVIPQPYNPAEAINIMEAASRTEAHQLQRRGYARLIERAIAEEMKLGTSREDISRISHRMPFRCLRGLRQRPFAP